MCDRVQATAIKIQQPVTATRIFPTRLAIVRWSLGLCDLIHLTLHSHVVNGHMQNINMQFHLFNNCTEDDFKKKLYQDLQFA